MLFVILLISIKHAIKPREQLLGAVVCMDVNYLVLSYHLESHLYAGPPECRKWEQ